MHASTTLDTATNLIFTADTWQSLNNHILVFLFQFTASFEPIASLFTKLVLNHQLVHQNCILRSQLLRLRPFKSSFCQVDFISRSMLLVLVFLPRSPIFQSNFTFKKILGAIYCSSTSLSYRFLSPYVHLSTQLLLFTVSI